MLKVASTGRLALAGLLALTVSACGGSATDSGKGAGGDRTVTDSAGAQVTVPAEPKRVLPLSEPTLDATLALGIAPVATTTGRGQNAIPAYLKERAKGIKSVGGLGAPNLEQVAGLAPDVILLDGTAFQDAAVIDKLRKIAPVVNVSKDGTDWRGSFEKTADVLGRAEQGDDVLAKYDARVSEIKGGLGANAGTSASIVRWSGIGLPAVFGKELCAGRVLTDLGLRRPAFQDQIGPGHSVPVSLEEIEKL
ncbi:MAG: ABC transporter substrate-binding protein, partial [Solirubrobacteraceae bacterium]|nr:ABC transporter substrate-binding protein [Solirubrobacteraceae bacterium]